MFYDFDELLMLEKSGVELWHASGSALINYDRNGDWTITEIRLDGTKKTADARWGWEFSSAYFHEGDTLFTMLSAAIEKQRSDEIQEEVAMRLLNDGTPLRNLRQQHSTLNYAQQGTR